MSRRCRSKSLGSGLIINYNAFLFAYYLVVLLKNYTSAPYNAAYQLCVLTDIFDDIKFAFAKYRSSPTSALHFIPNNDSHQEPLLWELANI